jgi:hypothetical protein
LAHRSRYRRRVGFDGGKPAGEVDVYAAITCTPEASVATLTSGAVVYGRQLMVERYWAAGPPQESLHSSVSPRGTVSKWVRRYLAEGAHHLGEIRPHPSPTQVSAELEAEIPLCAPKYGAGR